MEILYILLVLLVVTRFFGELAERAGQPALVGELLSGIVLVLAATCRKRRVGLLERPVADGCVRHRRRHECARRCGVDYRGYCFSRGPLLTAGPAASLSQLFVLSDRHYGYRHHLARACFPAFVFPSC